MRIADISESGKLEAQVLVHRRRRQWAHLLGIGLLVSVTGTAFAFNAKDADHIVQSYTKAFYHADDGSGYFKKTTAGGRASFWMQAEEIEMMEDAATRTADAHQLRLVTHLFNGFIRHAGTSWMTNEYNDDVMWMVIASARGYQLTKNPAMRRVAKANFDACYARAWSTNLGGGLWWRTDNRSKNACVNGPAAIAAYLLYRITGDADYLHKATRIFLWERAKLFDPDTGRVFDHIRRSGQVSHRAFTYNEGTFIGAANFLGYNREAALACDFTMHRLCRQDLLPAFGEVGDAAGFNGICVRWIARFMKDHDRQATYLPWLQKNADAAWKVRRSSDGLSWCRWNEPTPPGTRYSWGCSDSVVILQVVPPSTR